MNLYSVIASILNVKNRQVQHVRSNVEIVCYNTLDITLRYCVIMRLMSCLYTLSYYVRCDVEILCYNALDVTLG